MDSEQREIIKDIITGRRWLVLSDAQEAVETLLQERNQYWDQMCCISGQAQEAAELAKKVQQDAALAKKKLEELETAYDKKLDVASEVIKNIQEERDELRKYADEAYADATAQRDEFARTYEKQNGDITSLRRSLDSARAVIRKGDDLIAELNKAFVAFRNEWSA